MTYQITGDNGIYEIALDYRDEGVDLDVLKRFSGSHEASEAYVPTMDADVRDRYSHMFPEPELEERDDEEAEE